LVGSIVNLGENNFFWRDEIYWKFIRYPKQLYLPWLFLRIVQE